MKIRGPLATARRWKEGKRIHDLCDRFRAGINDPKYAAMDDQALLLSFHDLVRSRPESKGRTDEQIVAATITALELSVLAMEDGE